MVIIRSYQMDIPFKSNEPNLPDNNSVSSSRCGKCQYKPAKTRTVFDCAAEFSGTSLNKDVLQGPDFMNKLMGVLLRFRKDTITAMGDI